MADQPNPNAITIQRGEFPSPLRLPDSFRPVTANDVARYVFATRDDCSRVTVETVAPMHVLVTVDAAPGGLAGELALRMPGELLIDAAQENEQ